MAAPSFKRLREVTPEVLGKEEGQPTVEPYRRLILYRLSAWRLRGVSIKFCEVQTYRRLILYRLSAWLGIATTGVGHIFWNCLSQKQKQ